MSFEYFYGFVGGDTGQWQPNLFRSTTAIYPYQGNPTWNLTTEMANDAIAWMNQLNEINPSKPFLAYAVIAASLLAAVVSGIVFAVYGARIEWTSVPLHSAMESLGGLAAIAIALVLLQRKFEVGRSTYLPVAVGFLVMGLLEIFHAIASPGNAFVWLRVIASVAGGLGFALAWAPASWRARFGAPAFIVSAAIAAIAIGAAALAAPKLSPVMLDGTEFTPLAAALQTGTGALFIVGAARFWRDSRTSRSVEDLSLGGVALLFGIAEFLFFTSKPWDDRWWLWHVLRLIAYLVVFGYVRHAYLQAVVALQVSLAETKRAEQALRLTESQLRQAHDERERLDRDLHDSIMQSIYAIGLRLRQCQRLIEQESMRASELVASAITDLNAVLREVRNYIVGVEVKVMDGKELEASMTALVQSMESGEATRFYLQLDQSAASRLSAQQATHLLFIAKEAMSNALRHAQATNGRVSLKMHDGGVRLEVEDDGRGFDADAGPPSGHGIVNIRTRADKLGGLCEILSVPGRGTRITIDIPLEGAHAG